LAEPNTERSECILAAAAALIARYGYDKTTVDEIAHEAGVSKGAIYLHYKGKEALFDALLLRESESLARELLARLDADPRGATLFNVYRYSLIALAENPLLKAVYAKDRRVLGDYMRRLRGQGMIQSGFGVSVDFVKKYQTLGLIRADIAPEIVVYMMSVIRQGFFTLDEFLPGLPLPPLAAFGAALGDLLEDGLGGDADESVGREATEELRRLLAWGVDALKSMRTKGDETP